MSTGDTRTSIVTESFVDTFPVFDADGYSKVSGVDPATFVTTFRFNGAEIAPPAFVIDEPDSVGEYRVTVASGEFDSIGFYQIEVYIPNNNQIWGVGIQVIESLADIIHGIIMGTETVQIEVEEALGTPIGDTIVQVFDNALSRIIQAGRTNAATGIFDTTLDPGDYKVILSKSLTQFSNPYSITVADNSGIGTQLFVLVGTPLTVGLPASPQLCRVYGYLQSLSGQYTDRYVVEVQGVGAGTRSYVEGSGAVDAEPQGVAADVKTIRVNKSTGIWEVDLVRGALARIRIDVQGVDKVFRVPNEAVVNFKDIDPLPQGEFIGSAMGAASPFETPGP